VEEKVKTPKGSGVDAGVPVPEQSVEVNWRRDIPLLLLQTYFSDPPPSPLFAWQE
jgi:hypothetical protein